MKAFLVVGLLALTLMLAGCGGWASVHAPIGTALADVSEQGETLLRDARVEAMRSGGQAARDSGGDDTAVTAAVDAAAEAWECPIAAWNILAGRVDAYLRELLAALSEEREPSLERVVLDLRAAVEAYAAADACTDLDLPALPNFEGVL